MLQAAKLPSLKDKALQQLENESVKSEVVVEKKSKKAKK